MCWGWGLTVLTIRPDYGDALSMCDCQGGPLVTPSCEAATTIRQIRSGWWTPVAFVGGSLTVGTGSSNTAVTSWRRLFMRYLHDRYEAAYSFLGGVRKRWGGMAHAG